MSAFVVETELLDFILTFMGAQRLDGAVYIPSKRIRQPVTHEIVDHETGQSAFDLIGQILHSENVRSVNYRYNTDDAPDRYRYREHSAAFQLPKLELAVQVLKCCACFDYQACETPDYDQSDAARIITDIRAAAIRALPGYESAKWGAPERPATGPISIMSMIAGRA